MSLFARKSDMISVRLLDGFFFWEGPVGAAALVDGTSPSDRSSDSDTRNEAECREVGRGESSVI